MSDNINKDKIIEQYEKKQKRDKIQKTILLIIIILLVVLWILSYRLGRIGYKDVSTTPTGNDNIKLIKVFDDDVEITKNTPLNIFANEKFDGEKIIAPKSEGSYTFCVKNVTDKDITYDINFDDEMEHLINMKYKLKIDNDYIIGDEDTYMGIDELKVEDFIVTKDSINVFTLEWYWEDDDVNDTIVGSQKSDQYYTLNLEIHAKENIK